MKQRKKKFSTSQTEENKKKYICFRAIIAPLIIRETARRWMRYRARPHAPYYIHIFTRMYIFSSCPPAGTLGTHSANRE